ncbi:C2 domain-containing protein [Aureococcus anophagefferens]|nr:C2 domain-containing protein [Aureococcus anophagefferens]
MVREGQVAVDCEWGANAAHEGASLLQLAAASSSWWTCSLPTAPAVHKLLADVADLAFASRHVVVLGFDGEANDLPHLRAAWRRRGLVFPARVTRYVDVRVACARAGGWEADYDELRGYGLAECAAKFLGRRLDKSPRPRLATAPADRAAVACAALDAYALLQLYDRPEVASAVERERELPGAAAPRAPRRGRGRRPRGAAAVASGRVAAAAARGVAAAAGRRLGHAVVARGRLGPRVAGRGAPCCFWARRRGKSTALRDAAALVGAYRERHAPVGDCWVVDQSLELGGDGLAAHASLRPAERYPCQGEALHEAMLRVLRNHTPAAIVVDELVDRAAALAAADVRARVARGLVDDAALAPVLGDFEIVTLSDREAARRDAARPRKVRRQRVRNATGCVVELGAVPGRPGEWSVVLDVNAAVDAIVENGAYDAQARFYDAARRRRRAARPGGAGRRAASLAAARKEREAEDLDQRFREAARGGVKISPREDPPRGAGLPHVAGPGADDGLGHVPREDQRLARGRVGRRARRPRALGPIDSFTFKAFQLGAAAPRVRRVVPVRLAEDGVVMLDLDVDWRGSGVDVDLSARLGGGWIGASVPLGLDHVSFKATLRVRCVLGDRSPFAALVDVAFARKPEVLDFGLSVISGDITGLPSIPALVSNALEGVIDGLMVCRGACRSRSTSGGTLGRAAGRGARRAAADRGRARPAGADLGGKSDPFVVVEVGGADAGGGFEARETLRTATKSKTLNPTWDGEVFTLTIADPPSTASASPLAAALRYGKPASTDDAEAARGEVRLSPDAAVSILEEKKKQAVVEVRTGASKPWRFAPLDADASSWVAALEAASAALGLDGAALRSAGENGDAVDLYSGATVVVEILEARDWRRRTTGLSDPYAVSD